MNARVVSRVHRIPRSETPRTILIVEPDADRATSIVSALARRDRIIVVAADDAEALGALASGCTPDVVLIPLEEGPVADRPVFALLSSGGRFVSTRIVAVASSVRRQTSAEAIDQVSRLVLAMIEPEASSEPVP